MPVRYSNKWLIENFENGGEVSFIFFWGHHPKMSGVVDQSCLSQWYPSQFVVEEIAYKTAEHWMMANKALLFDDSKSFEKIIESATPREAKELGRSIVGFDYQTWEENKLNIVREGNIHKFNQNPDLFRYLLNTKDKVIVEASSDDEIWGIGLAQDNADIDNVYCWPGLNLLGFALMEVRDFLREFGMFNSIDIGIKPPWMQFPDVDSMDMFWQMGSGEDYIMEFCKRYKCLSKNEEIIYKLVHPAPRSWRNFYD